MIVVLYLPYFPVNNLRKKVVRALSLLPYDVLSAYLIVADWHIGGWQ